MATSSLHVLSRSPALRNVLMHSMRKNSLPILTDKLQKVTKEPCRSVYSRMSQKTVAYYRELYKRRIEAGPEPERHLSKFGIWNYDSEIFAFCKRFGEEFDEKLLKRAFTTGAYIEKEEAKRQEIGLEAVGVDLQDNEELAKQGQYISSRYIKAFLRQSNPQMFEEGICAIHDYLMSDTVVCQVAKNIGLRDLIMSSVFPPEDDSFVQSFMAVIGALAESTTLERAEVFVRDFLVVQLVGKDLNEMWDLVNPMGLLTAMLQAQGRGLPEPRLLWSSASETLMSVYYVGIYSDKQLIGKSPGETVTIAEEMAARESIKNLCRTSDSRPALVFGEGSKSVKLDYDKENISAESVLNKQQKQIDSSAS